MGGRKVTTTYRREYSPERSAKRPSIVKGFGVNHNYREYRRQLEHGHQKSPFIWEDWEYEIYNTDNDSVAAHSDRSVRSQRSSNPPASEKHEDSSSLRDSNSEQTHKKDKQRPSNSKPNKTDTRTSKKSSDTPSGPSQKQTVHKSEPSKAMQDEAGSDTEDSMSESYDKDCNCRAKPSSHNGIRGYKERSPQGQPPRVLSDTISKSFKRVSRKGPRDGSKSHPRPSSAPVSDTPFAQYGAGDDELETGAKRTFNVLAKKGVYPTVHLAQARQHQGSSKLRRSLDLQESRPHKETLHDPHFDKRMNRQTSRWLTEYNKNYQAFPVSKYKEHVDHRPPY